MEFMISSRIPSPLWNRKQTVLSLDYKQDTGKGGGERESFPRGEVADTQASASYIVQLRLNHRFGFELPDDQIKKKKQFIDMI